MTRVSILVAAVVFCVWNSPTPDPRLQAAINAAAPSNQQLLDYTESSYYCPMDPDIRTTAPGKCPRCGMKLVGGIPDIVEYPMNLGITPEVPKPGGVTRLTFGIVNPTTLQPVRSFEIVHERLYHIFLVSQDMQFFLHTHPEREGNEDFHLDVRLPKPGMYRVLSDFYPTGGTPQLITNTVMVPGPGFSTQPVEIQPDLAPKQTENSRVELVLDPPHPVAEQKVALLFDVSPNKDMQLYLGAWGHMLAASNDLIDMIHNHPLGAVDSRGATYKELQFSMVFPRPGIYRVWVQFQRDGVVNTVAFNVPVSEPTQ
jgi:hypothetical protein